MSDNPNCWTCRYFRVTWDPGMPYGCDAIGFKSRIVPHLEVLRTSGSPCRAYTRKIESPIPNDSRSR